MKEKTEAEKESDIWTQIMIEEDLIEEGYSPEEIEEMEINNLFE